MAKLNWSVQLVEISRSEIWYKKLAQIPIGSYESYLKLVVLVKDSKLLTFSYLNESDLELTLTNLDQELDNNYKPTFHCK